MTIKVHKLRGIDKAVCTAEQVIAYNISKFWAYSLRRTLEECHTEMDKSNLIRDTIRHAVEHYTKMYGTKNLNIDAVFIALNQGFRAFVEKPFIASNYNMIGQAFPIPYELD